ncbi:MAG: TRAP transporter permease [Anaerolineales bacterium]|nr:TRAP transporter permease [Anaerolineales bacterium]
MAIEKPEILQPSLPSDEQIEKLVAQYDSAAQVRHFIGWAAILIAVIAAGMSLFHISAGTVLLLSAMELRPIHMAFTLALIFLIYPLRYKPGEVRTGFPLYDMIFAILSVIVSFYVVLNVEDLAKRAGAFTTTDIVLGALAIILVIEAGRRATGWWLPGLAIIFLLYPLVGHWLPDMFSVRQYPLERVITHMYLTTEGLFGIGCAVSAQFVFLFVLFGAFLSRMGTGALFIDLALALLGNQTGGPAKVAVISSGLLGTINGSCIANVATTGVFTIPLMKRVGFKPYVAAAIEAAASNGGQLMPPVMGAAAFIMSEFIGVPYITIAIAATLPALLYFFSLITMVHLEAKREGLAGIPRDQLPNAVKLLRERGLLLAPILVALFFLLQGYTPTFAAIAAIATTIVSAQIRKSTRVPWRYCWDALVAGAKDALPVAIACIMVGFVVGTTTLTGIGLKIAGWVIALGQGNLILTMFLAMIASIVLGTGLPTTATYIVTATMAAPALAGFGVDALPAHLFMFYYGIIADVTPPVALAALVGAGIAGADTDRASWEASRISLAGFLIPFIFVLSPQLLLIGSEPLAVVQAVFTSSLGAVALAASVQSYLRTRASRIERLLLFAASLMLIVPEPITDGIGLSLFAAIWFWQGRRLPKKATA